MPKIIELARSDIRKISVVCPYYNEAQVIEKSVTAFYQSVVAMDYEIELILVNDGSTDDSFEIVKEVTNGLENVILITYPFNEGRGYALKRGIDAATGDIIVTTEIDLSWGEDIVQRIVRKFEEKSYLDCVIASPNLSKGKYKNVPFKRILISKIGNYLIRLFFVPGISMNTGMTRGYRKKIIKGIDIVENGKEFHLEVLLKLNALRYKIDEIPATLEWKNIENKNENVKRKSSTKIFKVIRTHINFLFFSRPLKYFWVISFVLLFLSLISFATGIYFLLTGVESLWMGMTSLLFAIFGVLFFGIGIITEQNISILQELWRKD